MQIEWMNAKELLDQLLGIQRERPDFDDLAIYVEIADQQSYEIEQSGVVGEYTETLIGEGVLYGVAVPEGFEFKEDKMFSTGHYLLLRCVEDYENEKPEPGITGGAYQLR